MRWVGAASVVGLAVALLVISLHPVGAVEPARDRTIDQDWAFEPRTVVVEHDGSHFEVVSTRVSEHGNDTFFAAYTGTNAMLVVGLNMTDPSGVPDRLLRVAFKSLIEFNDTNQDGRFGVGDVPIQRLTMPDMLAIASMRYEPLPDDGHSFTAFHRFPGTSFDGLFLKFEFVPAPTGEGSERLLPTEARLTISAVRFSFQSNNNTRLAFEMQIFDAATGHGNSIQALDSDFLVYQEWESTLNQPDGENVGVTIEQFPSPDGPQTALLYSYPRQELIEHRVRLGIMHLEAAPLIQFPPEIEETIRGNALLFAAGLVLAGVAIGVPLYLRARRVA